MDDQKRIENLEWAVRRLTEEVTALRAQVGAPAPARTPVAAPASADPLASSSTPRVEEPTRAAAGTRKYDRRSGSERRGAAPRPPAPDEAARAAGGWSLPTMDVEGLVGRYGALALAALTILLGVGAFISWAVDHVRLGPEARVALGALAAAAVATLGFRLRSRGARSYGNALLALALALVHLVAWGAGPYLHLIPDEAALAVSDIAAVALAILALREREQALFVVGLGGALVAPFVFGNADANVWALLAYGLTVRLAGARALASPGWIVARRVLGLGASAYALAALASVSTSEAPSLLLRHAPALFALLCAVGALAAAERRTGRALATGDVVTLLVVIVVMGSDDVLLRHLPGLALAGTLAAYAALARSEEESRHWPLSILLPLALLAAVVAPRNDPTELITGLIALSWTVAASLAALLDVGRARAGHLTTAGLTSAAAVALATADHGTALPIALAGHAALMGLLAWRLARQEPLAPAAVSLVGASVAAMTLLAARPLFAYLPFGTMESLAMATVAGAAALTAALAWKTPAPERAATTPVAVAFAILGVIVAFGWGRQELSGAFAPEVATFLLVGYYASVGTGALLVGRWRGLALARRAGLALAIFAALKALLEASDLQQAALRIGSYLLVGGFLLAVAYWYRGAGEQRAV